MRLGGALLLGACVTAAALAFGSRPLGVAGVGLLFAAGAVRVWAGFVRGPVSIIHVAVPAPATEGDRVRLRIEARRASRMPVGSLVVRGSLDRIGAYECRLKGHGRSAVSDLDLGRLPRGRFAVKDARLVIGDHLGLESISLTADPAGAAVVVHPRLVELQTLFSDAGRLGGAGRRLLLRRPAGFDFHSVREYTQGESLRRVHWPTTARRGQLMVKKLEDTPRDTVVVLLDCDPAGASGQSPESSFDAAVRAAGSVLKVYATRGRKATLVTSGSGGVVVQVSSLAEDFRSVLGVLAAVEPDARSKLARWLMHEQTRTAQTGELVVVTASLEPAAVDVLLAIASRRLLSVVWIDAPSYAGRPTRTPSGPLRLSGLGIPVAVVRRGDDLATALDAPRAEALAGA
ncbi:MAG: DUF58 domain-containing protein [Actinobacteria bacterium]|nr:DUF58 domain-containing protein [Actinomycetota bacterium]MDQ3425275.1 DUF58 domain-containing protein [Actinomycetota bacterium]